MTSPAAKKVSGSLPAKRWPEKSKRTPGKETDALSKISEYSLAKFLDDEPDLYSVADAKIRYR